MWNEENSDISTAPKDRRILAYGKLGFESEQGWGTVTWCSTYNKWQLDPTEATEYDTEACELVCWRELPGTPKKLG